jgi:hypothetical protein
MQPESGDGKNDESLRYTAATPRSTGSYFWSIRRTCNGWSADHRWQEYSVQEATAEQRQFQKGATIA